jgi:hypothetical protein
MLQHKQTLAVLQLSVCGIGPTEVEFLAAGLSLNSSLGRELNLSDNEIACEWISSARPDGLQLNKTPYKSVRVNNNDALTSRLHHALRYKLIMKRSNGDLSDNE